MRNKTRLAGGVLVLLLLAGCGSDPQPNVPAPNIATVAGAGERVDVGPDIQRGSYPDACKLIPNSSMATLLDGPVTSDRNVSGCAWTTGLASSPSVQVSWIQLGSDSDDRYDDEIGDSTNLRDLDVGSEARIYRIDNPDSDNKIVRVDVRKPRVFFRVDVGIVSSSANDVARAEAIATRVAQLVAGQVN